MSSRSTYHHSYCPTCKTEFIAPNAAVSAFHKKEHVAKCR